MGALADQCPACGEGKLSQRVTFHAMKYNGKSARVALTYSRCDTCGADLANAWQMRANKRAYLIGRREILENLPLYSRTAQTRILSV